MMTDAAVEAEVVMEIDTMIVVEEQEEVTEETDTMTAVQLTQVATMIDHLVDMHTMIEQ